MREQSKNAKSKVDEEEVEVVEAELTLDDSESDAVEVVDEKEEVKEKDNFKPGTIPDGQLDATRLYLGEIGFSPLLTAEEEVHYSRLAQKGEESGRKKMIESNLIQCSGRGVR